MDMVNIWIHFTSTNTHVATNFEGNVDMEMNILYPDKIVLANFSNSILIYQLPNDI
jgi:hypothetical protein